jgi:hypothetical protein
MPPSNLLIIKLLDTPNSIKDIKQLSLIRLCSTEKHAIYTTEFPAKESTICQVGPNYMYGYFKNQGSRYFFLIFSRN